MLSRLEKTIVDLLALRRENGLWQSEIEGISGYSKSHLSETIKDMESRGLVVRRKEGNILNRLWGALYFPGPVDGVVRGGILKSSEYLPALNILEKLCGENDLVLRVRIFSSSVDMLESLYAGSLEIAMAPSATQVMYAAIKGRLNFISAVATGGSGIYENEHTDSHYCSGSEISTMSYMTRKFLEDHKGISYVPYDSPDSGIESFLSGEVKYIATWEPYCRRIESLDYVRRVIGYSELLDEMPCCLMSCTDDLGGDYRRIFSELRTEYTRFCSRRDRKSDLTEDRFNIFTKEMVKYVPESLKQYKFISAVDTEMLIKIADGNGILVSTRKVKDWTERFVRPQWP